MASFFAPLVAWVQRWSGTVVLLIVFVVIFLAFTITGLLTRAYRAELRERAQENFSIGQELARSGRYNQAIEHYLTALSLSRDNNQYELALGMALAKAGRTREAESYLSETLTADPTHAPANLTIARIAAAANDVQRAVLYYHRAVFGLWPNDPVNNRIQTRLELADFLAIRKLTRQAIGELISLEAEAPGDRGLRMELAHRYLRYGVPDQAATLYREQIDQQRNDAEAWAGLGEAEIARGSFAAAQKALRQAVRFDPKNETLLQRLQMTDDILRLDPSLRLLSTSEQYRRSRALLERAAAVLSSCVEDLPEVPDSARAALNAVRTILDSPVRKPTSDDVSANLQSLDEVWRTRLAACSSKPVQDQVLSMIVKRLPQ